MIKFAFLSIICVFTAFVFSCSDRSEHFILENELFSKTFYFQKTGAGTVTFSLVDKATGRLLNIENAPVFEFVINHQLVSSEDNLWVFRNQTLKKLGNGGLEHCLEFEGISEPIKGLKVLLFQQIFPNSTLIRERLELSSEGDKSFSLNKQDDALHFIFPVYSFPKKEMKNLKSTEIRLASWEKNPITFPSKDPGDTQNHMFYPDVIEHVTEVRSAVKGPIEITELAGFNWISAYEHASQDNLNGILDKDKINKEGKINDAMQGTKGIFNFPIKADDFRFIEIRQKISSDAITVSTAVVRGGYLDGEIIDEHHPYSTVWNASAYDLNNNTEGSLSILRNYMLYQICEMPASRRPEFYYNTWGMQRTDRNKPLRGVLTYERIFEEIERAAELGVDIFVLDDGWEQAQGNWTPHKERLSLGLAPIKEKLDSFNIKMGVWLSPMGIDSATERYKEHPEWVIKDSEGKPIAAQWGHPAFDFVGIFFEVFVEDCKKLIDEGVQFFKFDAINTFYSSLPGLRHGSDEYSEEEIRARYEYLLPIYVTKAMEILTDYNPEVVIEIDVTEARRVMMGLAPMSRGKIFHMNNGASGYNDYSDFRANSMRTIPNVYNGIVPLELFTYANYPHNLTGNLDYNINTSLIAGHGFWGDLSLTTEEEREQTADKVAKSKKVLPYLVNTDTEIIGRVGDSPEIYIQIDKEKGAGQIIAFSQKKLDYKFQTQVDPEKIFVVLNHPFEINNDTLTLDFEFGIGPSTSEAFIFPGNEKVFILSSTCSVELATFNENTLSYITETPGTQVIIWKDTTKTPLVEGENNDVNIEKHENYFRLSVTTYLPKTKISVSGK